MCSNTSFCTERIKETLSEPLNNNFSLCCVFLVVFSLGATKARFADPANLTYRMEKDEAPALDQFSALKLPQLTPLSSVLHSTSLTPSLL